MWSVRNEVREEWERTMTGFLLRAENKTIGSGDAEGDCESMLILGKQGLPAGVYIDLTSAVHSF